MVLEFLKGGGLVSVLFLLEIFLLKFLLLEFFFFQFFYFFHDHVGGKIEACDLVFVFLGQFRMVEDEAFGGDDVVAHAPLYCEGICDHFCLFDEGGAKVIAIAKGYEAGVALAFVIEYVA